jgi:predicted alpha/beta-fold hydrolase
MQPTDARALTPHASHLTPHPFHPAWWCRGPHLQTLWPYLLRPRPKVSLRRERLELADGDFLDLDWQASDARGPMVLILHGLEGSSNSKYALGLLQVAAARGWRGVVMHFRGCSGEPNRLPRGYHSGETGDLAYVVATLKQREPQTPIAVVGYSLGGNVLLKWLGERRESAPISAAAAVSVPFLLANSARRMEQGFSRIYQWELVARLRRSIAVKRRRMALPLRRANLSGIWTFRDFDEHVTAPLHGFAGADDYYARASSRQYLRHITTPTLIVHSTDDPFMTPDTAPGRDELSPAIELALSRHGGHVGFVSGRWPWRPHFWLEEKIPAFLAQHLRPSNAE